MLDDLASCQYFVGQLIYLTITWIDINYSVYILGQFMHQPCKSNLDAALHLLRNLKGTSKKGILSSSSNSLHLIVYCNSHWDNFPITWHSTSGPYTFSLILLLFFRKQRNKLLSCTLLPKPSIKLWLQRPLCNG